MRTTSLLSCLVLSACVAVGTAQAASKTAAKTPRPVAPAVPTEIELSHQLDEAQAERLEPVVDRFNATQKEFHLHLVRSTEGASPTLLNLATREDLSHFVANRARFKPLFEVLRDAKEPLDSARLSPELRVGVADSKGRLMALPVALSTPVLFYNKALFRKAGLNPETPPHTWWEVQQAADKLFDAGSRCPYTTSWPAWVHIDNASAWNGAEVADSRGRLAFNGLVQIKHIAMLNSWYKSRFFVYFGRRDEADQRFAEGECGMLTSGSALYATLRDKPGLEVGVSALPYYDDVRGAPQQTLADGASLWVGGGHKPAEYKGAASFVKFLMAPDVQVALTRNGGFLPMTPAARAAVSSRLLGGDVAGVDVAMRQLQGKSAQRTLRVSQIEPVRMIVEEELEAVWANRKPAKAALDDAVERGNVVLPQALRASPL
ncbi:extracellular solute-binding protein [Rhodocyclus gracilis]|uniref:sn-glycerol-3-phosphate-binding periplasmic protein UgpB n=1 Tax=Rhodocyclus tenuis TaxID=1066 RepID=A0A6L5JT70_RHOTE|nr:extracellular solute-binding protein [Rhodocyclus gracilis]MQY50583.1 extracellular solute-binding protein [Rhodocyclus gracilis]